MEAGVAHLQLTRADKLNTMTPQFFLLLRDAVRQLDESGETRALVISSTGKHFAPACRWTYSPVWAKHSARKRHARVLAFKTPCRS